MEQLQELKLMSSNLRDPGFSALAAALGKGALPQLEALCVSFNAISDAEAFVSFLGAPGNPSCRFLIRKPCNNQAVRTA